MISPLRIELFAGLQLIQGAHEVITRFQTRKTAAMLAYLAFHRAKIISREVLADILWPDADPVSSRNSFRVALNSLRRQLEPPAVPPGAVLLADRTTVQLNPASFTTDVADFDDALRKEKNSADDEQRVASLIAAADLYKGPLLIGWYDEWIDVEQTRLAEVYAGVLRRLTALLIKSGEFDRALEYAHHAVYADPLREETNRNLMRLYAAVGQPGAALDQFRKLSTLLEASSGSGPSAATRELMKQISTAHSSSFGPVASVRPPQDGDRFARHWVVGDTEVSYSSARAGGSTDQKVGRKLDLDVSRGSIPLQFTKFFGREAELADLRELVRPSASRIVTITGPGGIGKSRLALQVAALVREEFFDGRAWVVPLSAFSDANQIPSALLGVLRLPQQPDQPILEQLSDVIGDLPALIVLDNLEQMVEGADPVVHAMLARLHNVTVLTTSRQSLGISGERDYPLAPLPIPNTSTDLPESLSRFASISLFVDRARNVRPDFQITPRNAAAIAEVCRRLDGLPLALELCAASIRLLSPSQMVDRLRADESSGMSSADLLSTDRREFAPRHRSLRTVMDDSYALLPDDLCLFFARLSVFRGGWSLDAAEKICREVYALDLLDLLIHRSLVVAQELEGGMRFSLLETIRHYSESKLDKSQREDLRRTHAIYYADLARRAGSALNGSESDIWCDLIEIEHNNLRVATGSLIEDDPQMALTISAALWRYWYARGYAAEGLAQIEAILLGLRRHNVAAIPHLNRLLFITNHGAGRLAMSMGNVNFAVGYFRAALDCLDTIGLENPGESDRSLRAMLMNDLAIAAEALGDLPTAEDAYRQLVVLYSLTEDPWAEACALSALGAALDGLGRYGEARQAFERSARIRALSGDSWGAIEARELADDNKHNRSVASDGTDSVSGNRMIAASYLQLGHIASERGDNAAAMPLLRDALSAFNRVGDGPGAAIVNERIAVVSLRQGDFSEARRAIHDALLLRRSAAGTSALSVQQDSATAFASRLLQIIDQNGIAPVAR